MNSSQDEIKIKYKRSKIVNLNVDKENQNPNLQEKEPNEQEEEIKHKSRVNSKQEKISFYIKTNPNFPISPSNNKFSNIKKDDLSNENNNSISNIYSKEKKTNENFDIDNANNDNDKDANIKFINKETNNNNNDYRKFSHENLKNQNHEETNKRKMQFLSFYMNKDKIDYEKLNNNQIKCNDISNNHKEKNKYSLSENIDYDLHCKKIQVNKKIENSLNILKKGNCLKLLWACLALLIYPFTIMLVCFGLELISGLISITIGVLLVLTILALPVFVYFYLTEKQQSNKDYYFFIISLSWISFWIIIKGLFIIVKGIFCALLLFFKAFYLVCAGKINHLNSFSENVRVGLGHLKLKHVNELDKMFAKKEEKTFVFL